MRQEKIDFIDFERVNALLEGFNKTTGFVTAILDIEGNVLSRSGWRTICTRFHRANPETGKKCLISDTVLANKMKEGEKYHFYRCLNGLVDVAVPVIIRGEHIANLFSGQFFFEKPDLEFFRRQAVQYGFDEEEYISALREVPIVSEEKVKTAMDFLLSMTLLISETSMQRMEQMELNSTIRENEEKFKFIFESTNVGKSITLPSGEINVNDAFCRMLGYTRQELEKRKWQSVTPEEEIPGIQKIIDSMLSGQKDSARFEKRYIRKDGSLIWADVSVSLRRDDKGQPLYFITFIVDIDDRKKLEEDHRVTEELFSNAFHVGPAGMTITRIADGKFIDANESFCRLLGYQRGEVVGHTSTDLNMWSPEERKRLIEKQMSTGGLSNFELVANTKSGSQINILFSSKQVVLRGEDCLITTMIDITDRKKGEKDLIDSERRYRTLFENMNAGFVLFEVVLNKEGKTTDLIIVAANEGFEKTTGLNLRDSIGKRLTKVLPGIENDEADWLGKYSAVALKRQPVQFEQGSELLGYFYSVSAFPAGPNQCAVTFIDITSRKKAEIALADSEERLRLSTELADVAVWEYDFVANTMSRSANHDNLYGLEWQEKWDINTFLNATHPDDREYSNSIIMKSVSPGGPDDYSFDFRVVLRDNSVHWLMVHGRVIERDNKGRGLRVRGTLTDITNRKNIEEELRKLNIELEKRVKARTMELEASNKELETFTYSVSHDLKAPLRGIDGYSKLLFDNYKADLNEEAQSFIEIIRRSTSQMNQLIDDLLNYSRLERSQKRLEAVPIKRLIETVISNYQADLDEWKFEVKTEIPDIKLIADPNGLTIALRNIVDNAIKFTKETKNPELTVTVEERDHAWIICVKDNGIGFNMQYHKKIFEIFQRLQRAEDYPGTGVGLAMVGKAMQRMKGKAWAESVPGKGSSFYLEINKPHDNEHRNQ